MEGLIEEAIEIIKAEGQAEVKDAALIVAAQKIEHYEIAAYGSALAHAELLDYIDVADLLEETLHEEKLADDALNALALNVINLEAQAYYDSEDDEDWSSPNKFKKPAA